MIGEFVLDDLLTLFVGIAAFAIVLQTGLLLGILLLTRRVTRVIGEVELTLGQLRALTPSLKTVAENLKTVSADAVEIGSVARAQIQRIDEMVEETNRTLRDQLQKVDRMSSEVADRANETMDVVQESIVRPVREVGALARGVTKGFEMLLNRKGRHPADRAHQDEELFI